MERNLKIILTGATGMVGEGVPSLSDCLRLGQNRMPAPTQSHLQGTLSKPVSTSEFSEE
ncbi:MAG: hypothetical protein R8N23_09015 [Reichenbachiella sp.]|uniref:hypothetical protein n=1 Tax=Reichenbachiella sp. TaxID=2184521 RepID=UPI0029669651|nr:hypothetical protein [Reichenbachiella sp.]MDW3209995.1 hypothetical protein [Reichenbachiella sp.]